MDDFSCFFITTIICRCDDRNFPVSSAGFLMVLFRLMFCLFHDLRQSRISVSLSLSHYGILPAGRPEETLAVGPPLPPSASRVLIGLQRFVPIPACGSGFSLKVGVTFFLTRSLEPPWPYLSSKSIDSLGLLSFLLPWGLVVFFCVCVVGGCKFCAARTTCAAKKRCW